MKKLIVLLLMILPLGAIAQEVKIAYVKTQEVQGRVETDAGRVSEEVC